jgi:hypothetical protein
VPISKLWVLVVLLGLAVGCGPGARSDEDAGVPSGVDGGAACTPDCGIGRACCDGVCVNLTNDPDNCGVCGVRCTGATGYCDGHCQSPPCALSGGCGTESCCGSSCCAAGQLCCNEEGPVGSAPICFTPTSTQTTCPQGCAPLCVSDRDLKHAIVPADEQAVLEAVSQLPILTWSYRTDDARVRHLGPMAQDFRSAFGLGDTARAYDPIDAHGVELAAIKALNARLRQLEAQNAQLEERLKTLEKPHPGRR